MMVCCFAGRISANGARYKIFLAVMRWLQGSKSIDPKPQCSSAVIQRRLIESSLEMLLEFRLPIVMRNISNSQHSLADPGFPLLMVLRVKFGVSSTDSLVRDINALMRRFWCGFKENTHKISWINWKGLGRRRDSGGLGF
jgi:hypothetical protein